MAASGSSVEFTMNDFKIARILGMGKFTIVFEVICKQGQQNGKKFAMKRHYLSEPVAVRRALAEQRVLALLSTNPNPSPFVQTLFGSIGGSETPSILATLGSKHDLTDVFKSKGPLSTSVARFYITEVMCALEYIHRLGVVHRDIKLNNIMLAESGHVVLIDFDMAHILQDGDPERNLISCGTLLTMAPEIAKKITITTKADIFSLGAISALLGAGRFRPENRNLAERFKIATEGAYLIPGFDEFPLEFQEFLGACLKLNHQERAEIVDLKALPYFSSVDWNEASTGRIKPPFDLSELTHCRCNELPLDPYNSLLFPFAWNATKPILDRFSMSSDTLEVQLVPRNSEELNKRGYGLNQLPDVFKNFNFTNPVVYQSDKKDE